MPGQAATYPLAATCSHLQPLAVSSGYLQLQAATCSYKQPLAATSSHLQLQAATCSYKQPLGTTCRHLPKQPLAATCSHLQPFAATCPSSHLQPLAATGKWLQMAAFLKIKVRTFCAHNEISATDLYEMSLCKISIGGVLARFPYKTFIRCLLARSLL